MKSLVNTLILSACMFVSVATFANNDTPSKKVTSALRTQIVNLIGSTIKLDTKENLNVRVSFLVNNKNEIVIVDVISKDERLNKIIKNRLNNKKVAKTSNVKKQDIYMLPIKVNKK
ncbi:conserved exported hypothetical protein [Tenacibaculum litopenaei]|jgi:hypothetical protein|uniref:hypothetical protein n=1 Tax=Tenacibaculum litopenaei TaxID=396016 RepID=UPI003895E8F0